MSYLFNNQFNLKLLLLLILIKYTITLHVKPNGSIEDEMMMNVVNINNNNGTN